MLVERHDLCPRSVAGWTGLLELEQELPLPLGRECAQNRFERRTVLELGGQLLDSLKIGEGVFALLARHVRLMPQQAPLLQIAKMVLGNSRVEAADLPMTEGAAS
jgi:hypothetical protein